MSETAISRSIQMYLIHENVMVERVQSGTLKLAGNRWVHCAKPGTPDLWTSLFGGTFLEVKAPKGKLSEEQEFWHNRARERGVRVFVVRSQKDVEQLVFMHRKWEQEWLKSSQSA